MLIVRDCLQRLPVLVMAAFRLQQQQRRAEEVAVSTKEKKGSVERGGSKERRNSPPFVSARRDARTGPTTEIEA